MIYSVFMQYMKHKMQITQKLSEYDLMTNFMNVLQQTTSQLQKMTVVLVTNTSCSPPTW